MNDLTLETAPIGTLAPAIMGGAWQRVERGWQWNAHTASASGSTFPRPGGDWDGQLIPPPVFEFDRYRHGRKMAEGVVITRAATEEQARRFALLLYRDAQDMGELRLRSDQS